MLEDKTIIKFNVRLYDITNKSFALGEKMSAKKLARNTLIIFTKEVLHEG